MATINFGSNQIVSGTAGNDSMIGTDPNGNKNDIIYGLQGDDAISTQEGLFNSTVYGGQGNDAISDTNPLDFGVGPNVIYGNLGNDTFLSISALGDTFYGGQGDDFVNDVSGTSGVIYGNLGNDTLEATADQQTKFYGGQGNDTVEDFESSGDVIYGNFGDDLLFGATGTQNSHEYGGQGNDTLVFTGNVGGLHTFNDIETGNLGNDLFIATFNSGGNNDLLAQDIVIVTDFLSGNDKLSETHMGGVPLDKIAGNGDNAAQALNGANNFYLNVNHNAGYVFVYGGTGAGYLFYNGDSGGFAALSGMAIEGATAATSVNLTDITTIPAGIPA